MTLAHWLTFLVASILIAVSPGSGAVLSMSHGLSYGVRKTTGTIFGLQLGLILLLVVAGAGVGSLLIASEVAFNVVKTVGALYLIYLGFSQWRARVVVAPELQTNLIHINTPSLRKRFLLGFFTNATNPKGVVFMVAVLPQFIVKDVPLLPQLAILALTMCDAALLPRCACGEKTEPLFRRFVDGGRRRSVFCQTQPCDVILLSALGFTMMLRKRPLIFPPD